MAAHEPLKVKALDGGMISSYPLQVMPQDDAFTRMMVNFDFDEIPGVVRKRYGTEILFQALTNPIKGAVQFLEEGTTPYYIVASGNKIYSTETGAWVEIQPESWTDATADTCSFETLLGILVVSDGVNQPFSWDGTTATVLTEMPKAKYLCELRNRVFAAGIADDPLALRACHVGDPTRWDEADSNYNAFLVYPGGEGAITSITTVEDVVMIGKKYSLHALVGTTVNDFQVVPLDKNIGIGSHFSVQHIRGGAYFCSAEGEIYRLEAGGRPERLSGAIQDIIRQVNLERIDEARSAVMEKFHYVITLPILNNSHITLIYDIIRRRWRMSDQHIGASARLNQVMGYCYTKPNSGQLLRVNPDSYNDGDDAIEAYLDTIPYHCGFPEAEKEFNNLWLGCWLLDTEATLQVEASFNGGAWEDITPQGILLEAKDDYYQLLRIPLGRTAYTAQFRLSNGNIGEQVRILELILSYLPREVE